MNERIRQLAEQAREYATTRHPVSNTTLSVNSDLFEQKFAELVVRDCMDVVDGYTKQRTFDTHYDAVEQIEALFGIKHFGVEE